jgi:uncharacterized protein
MPGDIIDNQNRVLLGVKVNLMRTTVQDKARLEQELSRLVAQLKAMGAKKIILFGSLARGELSLFSDIDILVLFEDDRSSRELTQDVYKRLA